MTDDSYARGLAEIKALRARLASIEAMATAAQAPPALTDRTPNLGDAIAALRATGTASGSAVDALRAAVEGPRTPAPAPDPARLAEATARLTADLRGSATIAGAYQDMQSRAARRNAGRVDPTDPATATAIDRLRTALSEEH